MTACASPVVSINRYTLLVRHLPPHVQHKREGTLLRSLTRRHYADSVVLMTKRATTAASPAPCRACGPSACPTASSPPQCATSWTWAGRSWGGGQGQCCRDPWLLACENFHATLCWVCSWRPRVCVLLQTHLEAERSAWGSAAEIRAERTAEGGVGRVMKRRTAHESDESEVTAMASGGRNEESNL